MMQYLMDQKHYFENVFTYIDWNAIEKAEIKNLLQVFVQQKVL